MKKIFILLLAVALLAGCQRKQLLQTVDAGIAETIVSESKQTKSCSNIEIVDLILVGGITFGGVACKYAFKNKSSRLMFGGLSVMAGCGAILAMIDRYR